ISPDRWRCRDDSARSTSAHASRRGAATARLDARCPRGNTFSPGRAGTSRVVRIPEALRDTPRVDRSTELGLFPEAVPADFFEKSHALALGAGDGVATLVGSRSEDRLGDAPSPFRDDPAEILRRLRRSGAAKRRLLLEDEGAAVAFRDHANPKGQ